MKVCLINVGVGLWYPEGQKRLADSAARYLPQAHLHMWSTYPDGVSHQTVPYGFKPKAMRCAVQSCNPDVAIWLDASAWFVSDGTPLVDRAVARGVAVWREAFTIGQWCADEALDVLDLDREVALGLQLVQGMPLALDLRQPIARQLLQGWEEYADAGAFNGPWANRHGEASLDRRVLGHRHDMPALSLLVHRLGVEPSTVGDLYALPPNQHPGICILAQGMCIGERYEKR